MEKEDYSKVTFFQLCLYLVLGGMLESPLIGYLLKICTMTKRWLKLSIMPKQNVLVRNGSFLENVLYLLNGRSSVFIESVMRYAIWYHLYNFKNVKNTHWGVLLLVKLQAKSNTPPWVFFTFLKLCKWY